MRGISIQTRVFFLALIPTIILSFLLGIYIIASRINDIERQLCLHGEMILNHIVNNSKHGILKENPHALHELTNIYLAESELESISFFGPQHELLAYSGNDESQTPEFLQKIIFKDNATTIIENKDVIIFTAPVVINNLDLYANADNLKHAKPHLSHKIVLGWVTITMSRTKVLLKEYQVILFTIFILASGIIISIFLARRTAKHLTQPLFDMRAAVKKLEQGQLETRLHANTVDEINDLVEGINKMAESLQKAQYELQDNIDQATADLQLSLETIEKKNIELAQAQKETLEASRIKSEFIANMSHEIRTPMNGMVGFTNLLLETELTTLQRNYLNTIQKSTHNLLNLLNNILDFSRLDAGQLRLEYLTFDIRDCIEEVTSILSPMAHAKRLEFCALIDDDIPRQIISDPHRLKQIMTNLVSNAIKFTENGEVIIRATLDAKTDKTATLRVSVSDTGIGLPTNDQDNIFLAFQQADNSIARKYGGTGLGLAICKKLVDQMHGAIGLENRHNIGSTFWFTFTAEKAPLETSFEKEMNHFTDAYIYLCEPHPVMRESLKNQLNYWKMNVVEFADDDALISQLSQQHEKLPVFIILGIHIKNAHASALLPTLKQYYQGPIVVLTNSSEQASLEYFLSEGAMHCLAKPVSRINLYHTIFQLMDPTQSTSYPALNHSLANSIENMIDLSDKKILCVDDNIQNANLITALLQQSHATVMIAHDGLEAIELSETYKFDLILLDLRMPKMDGYETLDQIRHSKNINSTTPIIALSAHISENECKELKPLGFDDYLIKPLIKSALIKVIKKWITSHNSFDIKPVIDWDQGMKLANNKRDLAEEMLSLLVQTLSEDLKAIKQAYTHQNREELLHLVHKLHGAVCYCGVPRLKQAISLLEGALKQQKMTEIPQLFIHFEEEVFEVLKSIPTNT